MKRQFLLSMVAWLPAAIFCPVLAADPTQIVNEGGIRDHWTLANGIQLVAPIYPAVFAQRGDDVCVALGYVIRPDGTTTDFTVLRTWGSVEGENEPQTGFWEAFALAGARAVSQWRFQPRPEVAKPRPTFTVATLHFMGQGSIDLQELRRHCQIDNLAGLIQKYRKQDPANNSMRRDMERFERESKARRAHRP